MIFVAVDIGGTFTDLIGFDDETQAFVQAKSLTTPAELTQGVINVVADCRDRWTRQVGILDVLDLICT